MCMSCECAQKQDDHGDSRHLTLKDLEQAVEVTGASAQQVEHPDRYGPSGISSVLSLSGAQWASKVLVVQEVNVERRGNVYGSPHSDRQSPRLAGAGCRSATIHAEQYSHRRWTDGATG